LQTTLSGEPEIEQHEIKSVGAEYLVGGFSVVDPIYREPVPFEAGSDRLGDHGIIFD
jgi:hypothetical protein